MGINSKIIEHMYQLGNSGAFNFDMALDTASKATILHKAATWPSNDLTDKLFAVIVRFTSTPNQKEADGQTPLSLAFANQNVTAVESLLEHPNIKISGYSREDFVMSFLDRLRPCIIVDSLSPILTDQNNEESIFYRYATAYELLMHFRLITEKYTAEELAKTDSTIPLLKAIRSLTRNPDVFNRVVSSIPMNLFERSIREKLYPITRILLKNGARVDIRDKNNKTLFWLAQQQEGFPNSLLQEMEAKMPGWYHKRKKKNKKRMSKGKMHTKPSRSPELTSTGQARLAMLTEQKENEREDLIKGNFEAFISSVEIDKETSAQATTFYSHWKMQAQPQIDELKDQLRHFKEQSQHNKAADKQRRNEVGELRQTISKTLNDSSLVQAIEQCKRKVKIHTDFLYQAEIFSAENKGKHLAKKAKGSIHSMNDTLREIEGIEQSITKEIARSEQLTDTSEIREIKKTIKEQLKKFESLVKSLPKKGDIAKKTMDDFKAGLRKFNAGNKNRPKQRQHKKLIEKPAPKSTKTSTPSLAAIEQKLEKPSRAATLMALLAALCK